MPLPPGAPIRSERSRTTDSTPLLAGKTIRVLGRPPSHEPYAAILGCLQVIQGIPHKEGPGGGRTRLGQDLPDGLLLPRGSTVHLPEIRGEAPPPDDGYELLLGRCRDNEEGIFAEYLSRNSCPPGTKGRLTTPSTTRSAYRSDSQVNCSSERGSFRISR